MGSYYKKFKSKYNRNILNTPFIIHNIKSISRFVINRSNGLYSISGMARWIAFQNCTFECGDEDEDDSYNSVSFKGFSRKEYLLSFNSYNFYRGEIKNIDFKNISRLDL